MAGAGLLTIPGLGAGVGVVTTAGGSVVEVVIVVSVTPGVTVTVSSRRLTAQKLQITPPRKRIKAIVKRIRTSLGMMLTY